MPGRFFQDIMFNGNLSFFPEDVNNDGIKELIFPVVTYNSSMNNFENHIDIIKGDGTKIESLMLDKTILTHVFAVDINKDRKNEMFFSFNDNDGVIYRNDNIPIGKFTDETASTNYYLDKNTAFGDFNGDNSTEISLCEKSSGQLFLLKYNNASNRTSLIDGCPKLLPASSPCFASALLDLDNNNKVELISGFNVFNLNSETNGLIDWEQFGFNEGHPAAYNSLYVPIINPTVTPTPRPTITIPPLPSNPGKAIYLNGSNYIEINDATKSLLMTTNYTVETWIKPKKITDIDEERFMTILSRTFETYPGIYQHLALYEDSITYNSKLFFSTGKAGVETNYIIPPDVWIHISLIRENDIVKLYINGALASSGNIQTIEPLPSTPKEILYIGVWTKTNFYRYKGIIDDLRISNIARNVEENWGNGIYFNSLSADENTLALWHFENNPYDSSVNNKHGTIIGNIEYIDGRVPPPTPTQQISLNIGWNWITQKTIVPNFAITEVLSSISEKYDQVLAENGIYSSWLPPVYNTLNSLPAGAMYMIHATDLADLKLYGNLVSVSQPINLHTGWNWIGYYGQTSLPVETALSSISGQYYAVLSEDEYYDPLNPNYSSLQYFIPNKGYLLKSKINQVLVYPSSSTQASNFVLGAESNSFCKKMITNIYTMFMLKFQNRFFLEKII